MTFWRLLIMSLLMTNAFHVKAALLTEDGKPAAIILVGPKSSDCARKGAQELQKFVEEMSGAKLQIAKVYKGGLAKFTNQWQTVILLGASTPTKELGLSAKNLKPDGYHIKIKDNIIAVVGKDSNYYDQIASRTPLNAGTLYGVYKLLDLLGVRFYQQDNTLVPKKKTLKLENMDLTINPYFPYRINELMIDPWFRRIGYGGDRDPWASRHSFHYWYKKYAKTHPEYFCLDKNGKSDLYYPAFTHKGVIAQIVKDAKKHFSRKTLSEGRRKYFLVLPNDYFMKMCSCSKCQAFVDKSRPKVGWYSDYVADAVVKVANAVKKDFPDCYIVYGAYERYQLPPKRIKKLPDNVVVLVASLRRASRPEWFSASDKELLTGWQKMKPQAIYFWRYYTYGGKGVPWVMPHLIADSIKKMKASSEAGPVPVLGEMHFFRRHKTSRWWQNINDYVTAKMLWNPDLRCDDILNDYYTEFYGPAADELKTFFELLEKNYMTYSDSSYIPKAVAFKLNNLLDQGLRKSEKSEYSDRINYIRENFVSLRKCVKIYQAEDKGQGKPVSKSEIIWEMSPDNDKAVINHNVVKTKDGLFFNGTDSYLQFRKPIKTGMAFTLEAWIRPDDLKIRPVLYGESFNTYEPYYIFGSNMNDPTYNNIGLAVVGKCIMFNSINMGKVKSKPLNLKKGTWYHIAAVIDQKNSLIALYLDGKLIGIETIVRTILNRKKSKKKVNIKIVGAGGNNNSRAKIKGCRGFFKGLIKDARIYKVPLSAAQILNRSKRSN